MSTSDLTLALECADIADEISLGRFLAQDLKVETKPDRTPVTDADKAVEEAIRSHIEIHRSSDAIVGEEYGDNRSEHRRYWVIDPIDGTANFLRGVPVWATLIALVERAQDGSEKVIVGVVSAPALFRRWYAAEGKGAFVIDGVTAARKISVSQVSRLEDASIAYSSLNGWAAREEKWRVLMSRAWRTRGYGDFWSHMLVAEGAVDIAAEPSLSLWDMAALDLIVREAGGKFSNLEGVSGPFGESALTTNGRLHGDVIKALS